MVPALYSILRPGSATALLDDEKAEMVRLEQERKRDLGLSD